MEKRCNLSHVWKDKFTHPKVPIQPCSALIIFRNGYYKNTLGELWRFVRNLAAHQMDKDHIEDIAKALFSVQLGAKSLEKLEEEVNKIELQKKNAELVQILTYDYLVELFAHFSFSAMNLALK